MLAGIFCLVMALYETFEYAACYRDEKKAQRQRMLELLQTRSSGRNRYTEGSGQPESQSLLGDNTETHIAMDTFDVSEGITNCEESVDNENESESQHLISQWKHSILFILNGASNGLTIIFFIRGLKYLF